MLPNLMFDFHEIAAQACIPSKYRPYFVETARLIYQHEDYELFGNSVLPLLMGLVFCCEIYAEPSDMAKSLMNHFRSFLRWEEAPGGIQVPLYHTETDTIDRHATFLAETCAAFVQSHPMLVERHRPLLQPY